jgi:predicted Zn-dependent peptidase
MDYSLHTLSNGLRIAYKRVSGTRLVNCGYIIHAGSRNDGDLPGLAHCLEHMVFKGTEKRKTIHVLNHLEVVGGEMNAFTTKEITAVYATVQNTHFARAADILSDVVLHSTIPQQELLKEKKVIADEINMYLDTPEENIYDEFHELVFGAHPLAHNILGSVDTLNKIDRSDILHFTGNFYRPENMVFAVVGNIGINRVLAALEKNAQFPVGTTKTKQSTQATFDYSPTALTKETDFIQAYTILGIPAYAQVHPAKWKMLLLNNLLGGPGLNSRLNLAIREKYGFTYHVESGYQSYSDAGLFHCYLSSEKKYIQRSVDLVLKELKKLRENKLGTLQLSKFKNQFMGQMVMADENRSGLMVHLGKGLLTEGHAISLDEVLNEIKRITASDLLEVANDIFKPENFSYLTYYPE